MVFKALHKSTARDLVARPPFQLRLEEALRHAEVAGELFIAPDLIRWKRRRAGVSRRAARHARSGISGVRFQCRTAKGGDPAPEEQCRRDVVRLVRSLRHIRSQPELEGAVLSSRAIRCRSGLAGEATRAKFGIVVREVTDSDSISPHHPAAETRAASICRRRIVGAARRSGFVVEAPRRFDPATGLSGLEEWAEALVLRRRARPSPWWLLLALLLLLPFLPWSCERTESFFGIPIETSSFVVLVDKSSSMEKHFDAVRAEVDRLLASLQAAGGTCYADVVSYDSQASSALGDLRSLDQGVAAELRRHVNELQAGGGTNLRSGLEQTAREVARHGRKTTLIVLTDGEDGSLSEMLDSMPEVEGLFGKVEVVAHTLTPRLFGGQGDPRPQTRPEKRLSRLAEGLRGHFGPVRNQE